jgi:hypothetical protein
MSILSRLAAVGLVAGGFAVTGDLGRLADTGLRVLNARDIPAAQAEPAEPVPPVEPAAAATPALTALPEADAPTPVTATPANAPAAAAAAPTPATAGPAAAPPVVRSGDLRPPAGGPEEVAIGSLDAGSRVVIWLAVRRGGAQSAYRCLVIDVVDPAEAEALLYEAVSFTADGRPAAAASAPRRIRLVGGPTAAGTIRRGQFAAYQPLGTAAIADRAHVAAESVGPIVAIDVLR